MDGGELRYLSYGRHAIDEADITAVAEVLRGAWLTTGPTVAAFERGLAARLDVPHAVSCSNGTAALHLACMGLDLAPGEAVIVPSVTFLATANAARMAGAEVVFADVDPDSGLMQPEHFAAALARAEAARLNVRAVVPVHLAGNCADLPAIAALARRRDIAVIEDACHALGGAYRQGDGTFATVGACRDSDIAIFSFHPVKSLAAGEGGAVTTRDADRAQRLLRLRSHGMVRDPDLFETEDMGFDPSGVVNPWYYEMPEIGWNYRLSDIHAALGLSQLGKLDGFVAERAQLAALYDAALARLAPMVRPIARGGDCRPGWHLYPVLIDFAGLGFSRAALMRRLHERGVGTQVHYIPVHRQPYYVNRYGLPMLPGADRYYARTLSLPLFVGMDGRDVDHVAGVLADAVESLPRAAMTTACIVQARQRSTRLPGKVMLHLAGETVLRHVLRRCRAIPGVDVVVCATVAEADCDPIAAEAARAGAEIFRGDEADVLGRYRDAARSVDADRILRVTSDCPLIDPELCGRVLGLCRPGAADFATNNTPPSWPHGLDCEAFTRALLETAAATATAPEAREHVSPWMRTAPGVYRADLAGPGGALPAQRWTLDHPEDFAFFTALFALLPLPPAMPRMDDVLAVLAANPALAEINAPRRAA